MTLRAAIITTNGLPWLYVTAPGPSAGEAFCVYDAPLNLSSKKTVKAEIDFCHERTGMPRPDLYDVFRAYQHPRQGEGEAA